MLLIEGIAETIIATVREPVLVLDDRLRVICANPCFYRVFQIGEEETVGRRVYDLGHGQWDIPRLRHLLEAILPAETSFDGFEVRHNFPKIGLRIMSLNARRLYGAPDDARMILLAIEDITERKQAEAEIREARDRFENLVRNIPDAVYTSLPDETGTMTYMSPRWKDWTGYNPEDLCDLHQTRSKSIHPDDAETTLSRLADARTNGSEYRLEYRVVHKETGEVRWLSDHGVPDKDDQGTVLCFDGIVSDITDRKLTEKALRQERDRTQRYLDVAGVMLIAIDPAGQVSMINQKGCEILGREPTAVVGRNWFDDFIPARCRKRTLDLFRALLAGEVDGAGRHENPVIVKPSEERLIAWHNTVLKDDAGEIIGTLSSGEDITEKRWAEEQVKRYNEELKRSNSDLEQFAYVASHDLQEPLRMISSYTQLLERRYRDRLDGDALEFIGFAVDGANRMQRMISDLLSYSTLSTGPKLFDRVDSATALARAIASLQNVIRQASAVITSDDLPVVFADESQLARLFQNLIENGIKFRGTEAPRIHISAQEDGDQWSFSVRDNGIGIGPEYRDRIFVIFQRLHRKDEYPGTGIGLTICKKIVERHGGRIWVESEPGEGTTFHFTIGRQG